MAEKKEYYIRLDGASVAVSREVYQAYYSSKRQEKTQAEKNERHCVVSYHALDRASLAGEEWGMDGDAPAVEEMVVRQVLTEELHSCLTQLSEVESALIQALYFEGLSERQLAARTGVPQRTIHDRKAKVIQKLKKMMKGQK